MEITELNSKIDDIGLKIKNINDEFRSSQKELDKKYDGIVNAKAENLLNELTSKIEEQQKFYLQKEALLQGQVDGIKSALESGNFSQDKKEEGFVTKAFNEFARTSSANRLGFNEYLLNSQKYKGNMEKYALSVDSNVDGGYTVFPEFAGKIMGRVFETSPMRAIASVQTISTDSWEIIDDNDEAGGEWVGERQARNETTTPTLDKRSIFVHEMQASPRATQKLLNDSIIDMEAWLAEKVADKFSRMENTAFVSGNGVLKPRGFLTYDNVTTPLTYEAGKIEQISSGVNGEVTADSLIKITEYLKSEYDSNAKWVMNKRAFGQILKFKNGISNYLFSPNLDKGAGQPFDVLGKPVIIFNDMAEPSTGSLSIAYGDFRRGYQIIDRQGISVLRDPYTAKPYVVFYTTKRVGGDVLNWEAIKILKLSA